MAYLLYNEYDLFDCAFEHDFSASELRKLLDKLKGDWEIAVGSEKGLWCNSDAEDSQPLKRGDKSHWSARESHIRDLLAWAPAVAPDVTWGIGLRVLIDDAKDATFFRLSTGFKEIRGHNSRFGLKTEP
jgi:hypothetical protein